MSHFINHRSLSETSDHSFFSAEGSSHFSSVESSRSASPNVFSPVSSMFDAEEAELPFSDVMERLGTPMANHARSGFFQSQSPRCTVLFWNRIPRNQ